MRVVESTLLLNKTNILLYGSQTRKYFLSSNLLLNLSRLALLLRSANGKVVVNANIFQKRFSLP